MAETAGVIALVTGARKRIGDHFFAMHAISPEDAVAYRPGSAIEQREFDRLRGLGIVREAVRGHYWLDRGAWYAEIDARRRKAVPVVIAVSVAIATVLLLFYRG